MARMEEGITRPVDNVVIITKGLQNRNINILDGTTVENKGKLILTKASSASKILTGERVLQERDLYESPGIDGINLTRNLIGSAQHREYWRVLMNSALNPGSISHVVT